MRCGGTGRRARSASPASPLVCRWDLDKTYLRSEFTTLRQLLRTALERPDQKVDVPGVAELIRALKAAAASRGQTTLVYFVSASPPQIGKAIRAKLALDGVPYVGIVFKNQLEQLRPGKFRDLPPLRPARGPDLQLLPDGGRAGRDGPSAPRGRRACRHRAGRTLRVYGATARELARRSRPARAPLAAGRGAAGGPAPRLGSPERPPVAAVTVAPRPRAPRTLATAGETQDPAGGRARFARLRRDTRARAPGRASRGRERRNVMTPEEFVVVLVTAGSSEEAARIGQTLVTERLAACANVVGPIRSIYRWQGAIEDAAEHLLLLKARARDVTVLGERVRALHSYEVPEVLALPIRAGSAAYLAWLAESTARES